MVLVSDRERQRWERFRERLVQPLVRRGGSDIERCVRSRKDARIAFDASERIH